MDMTRMSGSAVAGAQPAGFLERFVAYFIDSIIVGVAGFIIGLMVGNVAMQLLINIAIAVGYYVFFWTSSGATLGKTVMGLKVVNAQTGDLVDPGMAVLRYVGYIISGLALCLGFLWVIWDPKKQGWHDKIAGTVVVKSS